MLGIPGTQPAGVKAPFLLLQLRLRDLELALGLVDAEFGLTHSICHGTAIAFETGDVLVRGSVLVELGKALAPVEEAIDRRVLCLQVEEVLETLQILHHAGLQGSGSSVRSMTAGTALATAAYSLRTPGRSVAMCPGSITARPDSTASRAA